MSQQSPQKVLDRILNYPHKEKECVYLCGHYLGSEVYNSLMNHLQCPHCGIELIWYFRKVNRSCEPPQVCNRYICSNCRHLETVVYEDDYMNKTVNVYLKHDHAEHCGAD